MYRRAKHTYNAHFFPTFLQLLLFNTAGFSPTLIAFQQNWYKDLILSYPQNTNHLWGIPAITIYSRLVYIHKNIQLYIFNRYRYLLLAKVVRLSKTCQSKTWNNKHKIQTNICFTSIPLNVWQSSDLWKCISERSTSNFSNVMHWSNW